MSSELVQEPPEKKQKMIENMNNIYIGTMDKCIEQIMNSDNNLKPIISNEFYESSPLINVFVGHIKNVKDISQTILILNEKIPLGILSHLKRVNRRDIILCTTTLLQNTSSIQEYIESHVTQLKDKFEYFKEVNVPLKPPKVTKQYDEARKIWPCNFHPNEYHEKLVSDNFFNLYELKLHRTFMEIVFEVAKWYALHERVNININNMFKNINVTLVVDPNHYKIVTVVHDNREDHPMQHSVMLAIDNVAKTQKGGVWATENDNNLLPGIAIELIQHLRGKYAQYIRVTKSNNKTDLQKERDGSKKDSTGGCGGKDGPYLCTGYYVYMLKEPCIMCAMALVHARAKRLFFCLENSELGALKSVTRLQMISSLNHHFEVFTGFL